MEKEKLNIRTLWGKINYEVIGFFLLFSSVLFNPDRRNILSWEIYSYVIDYSHGIANKFLPGEIISWFTDYVPVDTVFKIALSLGAVLSFALSYIGGRIIRNSSEEHRNVIAALVFVMFLMPPGIGGFFRLIGVPDVFMVLALIVCMAFSRNKYLFFLVPILSAVSVGFHQNFTTLCYPALFVAMYYFSCKNGHTAFRMGFTVSGIFTTLAAFIYVTFFASRFLRFDGIRDFMLYLGSKSDIEFFDSAYLFSQYFTTAENFFDNALSEITSISSIVLVLLMISPFLFAMSSVFIKALRQTSDKKMKFLYFLCAVSWVPSVVMACVMTDMFRVLASLWVTQFLIFAMFIYHKDEAVLQAVGEFKHFAQKHKTAIVAYLLFMFSFRYVGFI